MIDAVIDALAVRPAPAARVVLLPAAGVLVVLAVPGLWRLARHLLTIVHEGAHAAVALLAGRRLAGIRLHSDTSGLTVSIGRPRGPGMVATAFAGYPGPAVLGLGAAWLLASGRPALVLWGLLVLVAVLALGVRNLYGLWTVLVVGALLWLATRFADPEPFAYPLTWFLLLGPPRAVVELARAPRGARDADVLARLTRVPAALWVGLLWLVCVGAAVLGGWWLVRPLLG